MADLLNAIPQPGDTVIQRFRGKLVGSSIPRNQLNTIANGDPTLSRQAGWQTTSTTVNPGLTSVIQRFRGKLVGRELIESAPAAN